MAEIKLENARRGIVAILEKAAHRDPEKTQAVEGIEDDLKSLQTLVARLDSVMIGHMDIQEVFAHLLDHVICDVQDIGSELGADEDDLGTALDDYVDTFGARLEAKMRLGARRCEALENVFANYWGDQDEDGDQDPDEDDDGFEGEESDDGPIAEPDEEGALQPAGGGLLGKLGRYRPMAKPKPEAKRPEPKSRFPRAAEIVGDVEIQGEE